MLRFAPWAVLAFSPLAQAYFERLHARGYAQECCPCPAPGAPQNNIKTVTVTEPAGTGPTVTVTLPQDVPSAQTVYITRTEQQTIIHEVTVVPVPSYPPPSNEGGKTVTVTAGESVPSEGVPEDSANDVYTKTVVVEHIESHENIVTVTIGDNNINDQAKTMTLHNPEESNIIRTVTVGNPQDSNTIKTVTVGNTNDQIKTVTSGNFNDRTETRTIQEGDDCYTVIVTPTPCTTTVTLDNGDETTVVYDQPHTVTVTSPPQTVTQSIREYQTISSTVTDHNGNADVEIIIINIHTGESTCKKQDSGLPCHDANEDVMTVSEGPTQTNCPPVPASTSTSTVYNTVVVTVGPEATGLASGRSIRARRPRAPMSVRRW